MQIGKRDRQDRIIEKRGGTWGTSSQDFARLARHLFAQSKDYANKVDGNCSIYTLSGVPMLFSALRCLLIELNTGILSDSVRVSASQLAKSSNDIVTILKHYPIDSSLAEDLRLLVEVRHEIIHPSHRPAGTPDNTPSHLGRLRDLNLLQVGQSDGDYIWLSQLQSHRLFEWAFTTIKNAVTELLDAHDIDSERADGIARSYCSAMS